MKKALLTLLIIMTIIITTGCYNNCKEKPVIYLYPTEVTDVEVKLDFQGELTCTYPDYNDVWSVTATPEGKLTNIEEGREYSYLYWEGSSREKWDMSEGFVVKGEDTKEFLQEKLEYMGLTAKEYNEFIVYWLPKLQENKYNLIYFAGEEYNENAKLEITPTPDSILRVMMVYKPLDKPIEIKEQKLEKWERKGFAVVEWGGTEVK
ncbi:hypothetical protein CM240_2916 [Clostridium bornimense]|uniref:Uncharacterized protein n=1 Tax=Clostridium bornimense TaxID=1216932 RepID=W6RZZ0_9CLOT|nr:hypothetical protein [Clostridium bornimense]CDM70033.1 hypothetical protein CM240_2916 [Clostridium bornimense]